MSDSSWAYLSAHGYDASACPKCGGKTGVLHTAREKRGYLIRPRECKNCGELYYTAELIVGWEKNEIPRKPRRRTVCTGEPDNSSSQSQALEPIAPKLIKMYPHDIYECGNCGHRSVGSKDYKAKYCPECGRAVKWDE